MQFLWDQTSCILIAERARWGNAACQIHALGGLLSTVWRSCAEQLTVTVAFGPTLRLAHGKRKM
jgi:hypothetical protein